MEQIILREMALCILKLIDVGKNAISNGSDISFAPTLLNFLNSDFRFRNKNNSTKIAVIARNVVTKQSRDCGKSITSDWIASSLCSSQ